mgnify:CR=1 FL=1
MKKTEEVKQVAVQGKIIVGPDGEEYLLVPMVNGQIGAQLVSRDELSRPTVQCRSEKTEYPDGRIDVTIHMPVLSAVFAAQEVV